MFAIRTRSLAPSKRGVMLALYGLGTLSALGACRYMLKRFSRVQYAPEQTRRAFCSWFYDTPLVVDGFGGLVVQSHRPFSVWHGEKRGDGGANAHCSLDAGRLSMIFREWIVRGDASKDGLGMDLARERLGSQHHLVSLPTENGTGRNKQAESRLSRSPVLASERRHAE